MKDWTHTHILNNLRRCTRCTLPETHETIAFDGEGVCNICRQHEYKREKIDWDQRKKDLLALCDRFRGKHPYDVIVPFSGGKDSTFAAWYAVRELKLKTLIVSFDHGFYRPRVLENNERTLRALGADFLKFRSDWKIVRRLMLESLRRKGDFDWHAHTGTFAYPMQVAVKYQVPFLLWGESSAEYTAYYSYQDREPVDERRFHRFTNLGITAEDMAGFLGGDITLRDLQPYVYPVPAQLRKLGVVSECLGSFIFWDTRANTKIIMEEVGWQPDRVEGRPDEYPYDKIEYMLQGPRDYLKFIKRGYARATHLTSVDIRNGRLQREQAKKIIEKYEGKRPASLDFLLKILGIDEQEWRRIALAQAIPPYEHDFSKEEREEPLPDMKLWNWNP